MRRCVDREQAFCVVDQRVSPRRRDDDLKALGATHLTNAQGDVTVLGGAEVGDDVGLVMLTSGSSGTPKAVVHTWSSLRASAEMTSAVLARDAPTVWFPCLPPNHIGGLAVLLRAIFTDARLAWDEPAALERGPSLGATHVAVVRAQLARHDLSSYDVVLLGGARPPGERATNVITTWGMTETGSGVVYDARALPGVDLCVVDGELCVKSPTLFHSYRDAPRPAITGPDGSHDWFPTGDGASLHDGVVSVHGRLGYVITTGGEKVWPDDLESVLAAVAGVRDVAVTSVPDDEWGERVVALIVSDDTSLDAALRDAAANRIGPWAKPKEIRYVDAVPRTPNGKIRRNRLAQLDRPT